MANSFQEIKGGIKLPGLASAPSDLGNGDIYYDTTLGKFRQKAGGAVSDLGGVSAASVSTQTNTFTIPSANYVLLADGTSSAWTATLPTAVGNTGMMVTVKKIDSTANAITIGTTLSQTIDGASTKSLAAQWDSLTFVSDGSNWYRV